MSEILQANIFFVITSIAVLVFTLFVCVILYYVIKIMQSIRNIVDRVEQSSEVIAEDVSHLRTYIAGGGLVSQVMGFFLGRRRPRGESRRKADDVIND